MSGFDATQEANKTVQDVKTSHDHDGSAAAYKTLNDDIQTELTNHPGLTQKQRDDYLAAVGQKAKDGGLLPELSIEWSSANLDKLDKGSQYQGAISKDSLHVFETNSTNSCTDIGSNSNSCGPNKLDGLFAQYIDQSFYNIGHPEQPSSGGTDLAISKDDLNRWHNTDHSGDQTHNISDDTQRAETAYQGKDSARFDAMKTLLANDGKLYDELKGKNDYIGKQEIDQYMMNAPRDTDEYKAVQYLHDNWDKMKGGDGGYTRNQGGLIKLFNVAQVMDLNSIKAGMAKDLGTSSGVDGMVADFKATKTKDLQTDEQKAEDSYRDKNSARYDAVKTLYANDGALYNQVRGKRDYIGKEEMDNYLQSPGADPNSPEYKAILYLKNNFGNPDSPGDLSHNGLYTRGQGGAFGEWGQTPVFTLDTIKDGIAHDIGSKSGVDAMVADWKTQSVDNNCGGTSNDHQGGGDNCHNPTDNNDPHKATDAEINQKLLDTLKDEATVRDGEGYWHVASRLLGVKTDDPSSQQDIYKLCVLLGKIHGNDNVFSSDHKKAWDLNTGDVIAVDDPKNLAILCQDQAFADKLQAQRSQIQQDLTTQSA